MAKIEFEAFGQVLKYGIFRTCTVYVDQWDRISDPESRLISSKLQIISLDLRAYGAHVVRRMTDQVSHVVCDESLGERVAEWKRKNHQQQHKFHLISSEWVADSIARGRMVDEVAYTPQSHRAASASASILL